jgi:hypothetical protein
VSRVRNYGWNKRKGAGKILIYGMRSLLGIWEIRSKAWEIISKI